MFNYLKRNMSHITGQQQKGIKDSWKEYMEKLMNEENDRDHRILTTVKEGPADCIRIDEVAEGDIRTQWILDLCNGIVKEGCKLRVSVVNICHLIV